MPRFNLVGRVAPNTIGPVPAPTPLELAAEKVDGPPLYAGGVGLPGPRRRAARTCAPGQPSATTCCARYGHNAPLRVLDSVEGDDGDEWYSVNGLDPHARAGRRWATCTTRSCDCRGCTTHRLTPDRADVPRPPFRSRPARTGDADRLRGRRTDLVDADAEGHRDATARRWAPPDAVARANETMTSERVYPPIPRDAPGGYYLTGVLCTQYFTSDGASIHYNYWS